MKKIITILLIAFTLFGTSAFILKYNTGIAGYSGSPGEGTCGHCHGGASSSASGITITAVPEFSVNENFETEYMPDSVYAISIEVEAASFSKYGFASQILNSSNTNAGTLQNASSGVKFINSGGRKSAVHSTVKNSTGTATFSYKWIAPPEGEATIYAIANAVNGNNSTSGDFVVSPVSLALVAAPAQTVSVDSTSTVGIKESKNTSLIQVSIFPNPANDLSTISYNLRKTGLVCVELIDLNGKVLKQLYKETETPGYHSQILSFTGIASGVYFIKTSFDKQKVSQKLITVQ